MGFSSGFSAEYGGFAVGFLVVSTWRSVEVFACLGRGCSFLVWWEVIECCGASAVGLWVLCRV